LRIIPVGTAVQIYRKALPVKYTENSLGGDPCGKCEFVKNDQGEFIAKGDVFHFNHEGEYLQALVWTAKLFNVDVTGCKYVPQYLKDAPDTVKLMQKIANEVAK
jgi:hypothetical protein